MSKVNRTLARLRLCRMRLRREGKLSLAGYNPPHGEDVQRLWIKAGWQKPEWRWDYGAGGWRPVRATVGSKPVLQVVANDRR